MIANLLSLYLMTRLLHSEGRSIWDVIDFQRDRLGKDLLWGCFGFLYSLTHLLLR